MLLFSYSASCLRVCGSEDSNENVATVCRVALQQSWYTDTGSPSFSSSSLLDASKSSTASRSVIYLSPAAPFHLRRWLSLNVGMFLHLAIQTFIYSLRPRFDLTVYCQSLLSPDICLFHLWCIHSCLVLSFPFSFFVSVPFHSSLVSFLYPPESTDTSGSSVMNPSSIRRNNIVT